MREDSCPILIGFFKVMAFPERNLEILSVSGPLGVEIPEPPTFLRQGEALINNPEVEIVGGREDLSLLLRAQNQSFILVDYYRLSELTPLPDISQSADLVTAALMKKTSLAFLTGAMRSAKSEVFNRVVIDFVNENIKRDHFPPPVVVGRTAKARRLDSIIELQDKLSFMEANFDLEIKGPLDFLHFVAYCLKDVKGGLKLAALEEAGVLLFSRPEYLRRIQKAPEEALEKAAVPEEFRVDFMRVLADGSETGFGQEMVLMAQVLESKGIKLLLVGLDRFTSGHPWEPMTQLNNFARENQEKVLIHRRFAECVGCGQPAVISTVTKSFYWEVNEKRYRLYPFMHDLSGLVKAVDPYYAPLCEKCNDRVRPEIASADWPVIEWPA